MSFFSDLADLHFEACGEMIEANNAFEVVKCYANVLTLYRAMMNCGGKFLKTGRRKAATKLTIDFSKDNYYIVNHSNADKFIAYVSALRDSVLKCVDTEYYSGKAPNGVEKFAEISVNPILLIPDKIEFGGDKAPVVEIYEKMKEDIKKIEEAGIAGNKEISKELFEMAKSNLRITEDFISCFGYIN